MTIVIIIIIISVIVVIIILVTYRIVFQAKRFHTASR